MHNLWYETRACLVPARIPPTAGSALQCHTVCGQLDALCPPCCDASSSAAKYLAGH